MNRKSRKQYFGRLIWIANKAVPDDGAGSEVGIAWSNHQSHFALRREAWGSFEALVETLAQTERWGRLVSEQFIIVRLLQIIAELPKSESAAQSLFDKLVTEVETYSVEREVYIPIRGLRLEIGELQIGLASLVQMTDERLEALLRLHERSYLPDDRGERRDKLLQDRHAVFRRELLDQTCSIVRVIAEPDRALEIARQETRRALDVLIYGNATAFPDAAEGDAVAGFAEETAGNRSWILAIGPDKTVTQRQTMMRAYPIVISSQTLEEFEEVGVIALSNWLAKPREHVTEIEDSLIRAVHWFAAAQGQNELENQLLNLTTCLESMLGPNDGQGIRQGIAEAAAFVMEKRPEGRRAVRQYVRETYKLRSQISHGEESVVTEGRVKTLRWVCGTLIATLVRWSGEIRSKQSLFEWIDRAKLSGAIDDPIEATRKANSFERLRVRRGLSLQDLAEQSGQDVGIIEYWEQTGGPRDLVAILRLAEVLEVSPEVLVRVPYDRLIDVFGHRFLLTSRRLNPGKWIASTSGWDPSLATHIPEPVIPDPEAPGPGSFSTFWFGTWEVQGFSARDSLDALERWIAASAEEDLKKLQGNQTREVSP